MILLYGDKLTNTQKAIGLRSNGLHSEIRFSDRYGRISFSCTLADDCGCCRFKMIDYSHPYRQSRVRIAVTAEQEARLFAKACEMADTPTLQKFCERNGNNTIAVFFKSAENNTYYRSNAIKYDRWGARLSFISRRLNWWKMHPNKMICNEACATVLLGEWPDLLTTRKYPEDICTGRHNNSANYIEPSQLTPDQLDYLVEYYFNKELA
jgi:hypothetical protein